ncbi:MAG: transporter, partial [Pyrinomonadaceae bacterium]
QHQRRECVGVKVNVYDAEGLAIGLRGDLSLPAGSANASSGEVDPTLGFLWSYALAKNSGLYGTVLLSSLTKSNGKRIFEADAAVGMAFSLTDRVGSYVEYFGLYPDNAGPAHNINGGFTYLFTNYLQFDINAGVGLNKRANDFFAGVGLAWRW